MLRLSPPRAAVLPPLMLATSAHALGANMSGSDDGVFLLILAAVVVGWLVLAWFLARLILRKFTSRKRWRALLAAFIALSPLSPFVVQPIWAKADDKLRRIAIERRTKDANAALERLCASRPARPATRPGVVGADGLRVEAVGAAFDMPGLDASAPSDSLDALQFATPVAWSEQESDKDLGPGRGIAFVEARANYLGEGKLAVSAGRAWWKTAGRQHVSASDWATVQDDLGNPDNVWIRSELAGASQARYVITLADISTRDDRAHWVARGRMQLTDRRDGHVVAEYIGFSANQMPGELRAGNPLPWAATQECAGPERRYAADVDHWQALRFFFNEVVQVK